MNTKEVILSRRSCRKYQTKEVPKEIMEDIILAGRSAPTGLNRQSIKFYIIHNNVEKIKSIGLKVYENRIKAGKAGGWMDEIKEKLGISDPIFYEAPCIIALVGDKNQYGIQSYMLDAGIACQNIINMATNYGLGTVPIGIANFLNQEAVLDGIGADKNKEDLLLVISMGYPDEKWKDFVTPKELTPFVKFV